LISRTGDDRFCDIRIESLSKDVAGAVSIRIEQDSARVRRERESKVGPLIESESTWCRGNAARRSKAGDVNVGL
jgi:hypothetical protein